MNTKLKQKLRRSFILRLMALALLANLTSCGDPNVSVDSIKYEPKIVVEGYLYPGETVHEIRITRNIPLNQTINIASLVITDAIVKIDGVQLQYDSTSSSYKSNALMIEMGKTYTLDVSAVVAGKALHTTATTTTPSPAFKLLTKNLGIHSYGDSLALKFVPLSNTDFYAFSICPDTASAINFIYNNDYRSDITPDDVMKNIADYQFQMTFAENIKPGGTDTLTQTIHDFDTWFHAPYKVIIYAGDQNMKYFALTAPNVKEFDGNFHEPKQILTGDGIGVFASAIKDTAYFTIK